jgi:hypothetical protein
VCNCGPCEAASRVQLRVLCNCKPFGAAGLVQLSAVWSCGPCATVSHVQCWPCGTAVGLVKLLCRVFQRENYYVIDTNTKLAALKSEYLNNDRRQAYSLALITCQSPFIFHFPIGLRALFTYYSCSFLKS